MTRMTKLTLCALLALTPALASAQTLRLQTADPAPRGFTADPQPGNPTAATAAEWSERGDVICGGDSLIIYEEDENGQPVGGVTTSCLDD